MTLNRHLITAMLAIGFLSGSPVVDASISTYFSAGTTCAGPPVVKFRAGGPDFKVTLCLSATEESLCGHSLQLEAGALAASGRFDVVSHAMGANYPDPTLEKMLAPLAISQPALAHDFGGTRDNPAPPSANQILVTFTLRARPAAKDAAYQLKLGKHSLASVARDGSCLQNTEVPLSAILKLTRE